MTESRRTYDEGCIAAHALDLIGDRWALLVVRELLLGPRRFGALRAGLPGISANILTRRLVALEQAGILHHDHLRDVAGVGLYHLTPAGQGLWPVIRALCHWGAEMPGHDPRRHISPAALMLSMRAMCARGQAGHHRAGFDIGGEVFAVTTGPGAYHVVRGTHDAPGLRFRGTANLLAAVIYGPRPLSQTAAGRAGHDGIGFDGDLAEGQAFIDLFHLRRVPA